MGPRSLVDSEAPDEPLPPHRASVLKHHLCGEKSSHVAAQILQHATYGAPEWTPAFWKWRIPHTVRWSIKRGHARLTGKNEVFFPFTHWQICPVEVCMICLLPTFGLSHISIFIEAENKSFVDRGDQLCKTQVSG
jgi:hypothetical protein